MRGSSMAQGASTNAPPKNVKRTRFYCGNGTMVEAPRTLATWRQALADAFARTHVTLQGGESYAREAGVGGQALPVLEAALRDLRARFRAAHQRGNTVILVGNGGSAAIASHMAVDYTKNGGIRARALNDAPTLTCLANDLGHTRVFAAQLRYYARAGDWVVIVSSSGRSPNVVQAGRECTALGLDLVTLTGMAPENRLRGMGALNFWVPSEDYGIVEITHLSLLHTIVSVPDLGEGPEW
jgi:D-sedoheptulose 7-phosphate isomerase